MKKKKKKTLMYVLGGGILKEDFITRHTVMIVLVVFLFFVYISNRYTCLLKLREIDRLQNRLKEMRYEATQVSAVLTSETRPSQVERQVKKLGLDIQKAIDPPYRLKQGGN